VREAREDRWRRLNRAVREAWEAFNALPGVLSGIPAAERGWRLRAVDAAIDALATAEERRRAFRSSPSADREAYLELLGRLRPPLSAAPDAGRDPLTGLSPGDAARVELRLDCASPQEIAALAALVRVLPEGAVRIETAAALRGA
jgi:hypothetical protein